MENIELSIWLKFQHSGHIRVSRDTSLPGTRTANYVK